MLLHKVFSNKFQEFSLTTQYQTNIDDLQYQADRLEKEKSGTHVSSKIFEHKQ